MVFIFLVVTNVCFYTLNISILYYIRLLNFKSTPSTLSFSSWIDIRHFRLPKENPAMSLCVVIFSEIIAMALYRILHICFFQICNETFCSIYKSVYHKFSGLMFFLGNFNTLWRFCTEHVGEGEKVWNMFFFLNMKTSDWQFMCDGGTDESLSKYSYLLSF